MKQNIIHTLWMAVVLPLLLASCQQEEFPGMNGTSDLTPLAITVTDGGYAPADGRQKTVTRAIENGYRTDFTAGDECGLYIVRDGKAVYENVKLTATAGWGGGLTWRPEKAIAGGTDGDSYFLYYPYQADMTGKTNAFATDDSDFFAPLISGWQPAADQRDYATGYAAGDLMTATGTATKDTNGMRQLWFSMTHRMALAIVEIPKTVYKFSDTSIPDYVMDSTTDFGNGAKPYGCMDGTYRYLVRPGQSDAATLTGYYADGKKEFAITPNNIDANTYKVYKVDGLVSYEKKHDLQPGDYFCKNSSNTWYIIPRTETPGSECIGVVFYTGHHPQDKSDFSSTGIGQKKCHGYVVALQNATNRYCIWGKCGTELGLYPTEKPDGYTYMPVSLDWSGYSYTQTIIHAAGGKENLNATEQEGYPATYYAVVDYEKNKAQAPSGSSGWFLPSIGQLWKIYDLRSVLFAPESVATDLRYDNYWSSSEDDDKPAEVVFYFRMHRDHKWRLCSKDYRNCYVRPVLAF